MRLAARCALLYAGCVALPLLGLSWLAFESSNDAIDNQARASLSSGISDAMSRFVDRLDRAAHDLDAWTRLDKMQDVLIGDAAGDLGRELEHLRKDAGLLRGLMVLDTRRTLVAVSGEAPGGRQTIERALGEIAVGRSFRSDVMTRPDGSRVIVFGAPIRAGYDRDMVIGALVATIDWSVVQRELGSVALLGNAQDDDHRFVLVSRADDRVLFDSLGITDIASSLPREAGYSEIDLLGRRYMVSTAHMPGGVPGPDAEPRQSLWTLHAMLAEGTVHAASRGLRDRLVGLAAGALALATLALALSLRALLRPVLALVEASDRIVADDFDWPLPAAGSDEIGALTRSFGHMRDTVASNRRALLAEVQERYSAEQRMREAHEAALEASRAKSRFLAAMSHEIRTPINGVLGMADLLLKGELKPQQRRFAENIERSGAVLLGVVNDILDLSRIEAGRFELDESPFDLRETLEDSVEMLADTADRKRLELNCVLPPDLPSAVRGDALRLRQVLINLLGNAIKFTERGEVTLRVECQACGDTQVLLRFEVIDTGIGMDEQAQQYVFDAFRQAEAGTTRRFGGTGLGLTISRYLVGLMGGEIGVRSKPGHGSTFWFSAPLERVPATVKNDPGVLPLVGLRVLLVDDNATNREVLSHQLTDLGAEHASAAGGAEGLQVLIQACRRGDPFDAAVIDHQMPGMTGIEMARAVREESELRGVALVLLSSLSGSQETADWREAGFGAYLTKPIRRLELRNCLEAARRHAVPEEDQRTSPTTQRLPEGSRVLLAEDHPVNREVQVAMLHLLGCEVEIAGNGMEALASLARERFDVVLMDCDMPVMDGFEATALLRHREQETGAPRSIVIALTANSLKGDRERCLAAGMDDYLSKPVVTDMLRETLLRWLPSTPSEESATLAAPVDEPALDPEVIAGIRAIRSGDSQVFLSQLAERYSTSWESDLRSLREAVAANELDTVQRLAHRLKSSSASLGARLLAARCQHIEDAARAGQLNDGEALVQGLAGEHARVTEALSKECRRVA